MSIAMTDLFFRIILKYKIFKNSFVLNKFHTLDKNIPFYTISRPKSSSHKSNEHTFGKYKFHPEVENQINIQINHEQWASQIYLAIASYFGNVNIARNGCYHYFFNMHKEETQHAHNLVKYQLLRGGKVQLKDLRSPSFQDTTILQYFERALKMEMNITDELEHLIQVAEKHKDYQCADYITDEFLKEQISSIHELSNLITNVHNLGNNEINIYIFDLELEKKYSKVTL